MEVLFVSSITFESTANIGILGAAREVQQVGQGPRLEPAADDTLGQPVGAVDVGGVEEVDAGIEGPVHDAKCRLLVAADLIEHRTLIVFTEGQSAETQARNLEPACPEVSVFHDSLPHDRGCDRSWRRVGSLGNIRDRVECRPFISQSGYGAPHNAAPSMTRGRTREVGPRRQRHQEHQRDNGKRQSHTRTVDAPCAKKKPRPKPGSRFDAPVRYRIGTERTAAPGPGTGM